jgi:short subunit dehydrogenase-like uncharacterized protein
MKRPFDIVVLGATGFTGKLVAAYLARKAPAERFTWAIAGRNRAKLEEVRARVQASAPGVEVGLIEASTDDPASLAAMARQARVLLTTVGPYAQHGHGVVDACIQEGTDYVDITGEPIFVRQVIDRHHAAAQAAGLRVVSCCGFDSIPHDLGAAFTLEQLPADVPVTIEGFVQARGTFSGGTFHSAVGLFADLRHSLAEGRFPRVDTGTRRVRGLSSTPRFEPRLGGWACPLPTIDPQIVLRSAALVDRYGPDFRYGHRVLLPSLAVLVGGVVGVGALVGLAQIGPARRALLRAVPQGEGPSAEKRERSWFKVTFLGEGGGRRVKTVVSGGDPGYTETAKMVAESALCLALDRDRLPGNTGVITPAAAMGAPLRSRLVAAGMRFDVLDERPA